MILTFKIRVAPTKRQHAWLAECLDHTRALYNAALQERLDAYRRGREIYGRAVPRGAMVSRDNPNRAPLPALLNNIAQSRELTELRRDEEFARFPRRMQRWVVDKVETAHREMVKRRAAGERCEVRFRGRDYWHTIGFDSPIDFEMRDRGLYNRKATAGQTLRLRPDRELPPWDRCKALTLTRDGRRWFACLSYEVPDPRPAREYPSRPVGLDVGLKTAVARSDGALLTVEGEGKVALAELRRAGRALARCKKRSKRRRKVREHLRRVQAKIARRREARLQKLSARLIHHFDAVAVEKLNLLGLENMGGGGAKGRGQRRKWRDYAPGRLFDLIEWKAQRGNLGGSGRARQFIRVDPRRTSQTCPECGTIAPKLLRDRLHICGACGHVEDRDTAAAKIVLNRAGWGPGQHNPGVSIDGPAAGAVRDAVRNTARVAPGHDAAETPLFINASMGNAAAENPVVGTRSKLHRRINRMREECSPRSRG